MKLRTTLAAALATGLLTWAAACASSTPGVRRDSAELLPEEIAEVPVSNLYEAVERLRPRWFQIRSPRSMNMSTEVAVILNSSYLGGPETLRQIAPTGLIRMRYLEAARATALYRVPDGRAVEGAIIVEMGAGR